jgi:beta-phosphoglucomutase-like phosphatase (HAD superfamily)
MDALLFDMDGVVVDSEDYWHRVGHNAETDLSACDVVCAGSAELREELFGRLEGA